MLLIPTNRGAHVAYCDADCAAAAGARQDHQESVEVQGPRTCLTCHHCTASVGGSHCLCLEIGTSCFEHVWLLSEEPQVMLDALGITMEGGQLTDSGWDRAVLLAENYWHGSLVALAWLQSLTD